LLLFSTTTKTNDTALMSSLASDCSRGGSSVLSSRGNDDPVVTSPTHRTIHPCAAAASLCSQGGNGPFLSSDDHRQSHVTQHPHPACEPLLVGRYGGADDDDDDG
jgi:hypothetical protein